MCIETTTTYENCNAVRIHLHLCTDHIDHTHRQVDNEPCQFFTKKTLYVSTTARCNCKYDSAYTTASGRRVKAGCERAASKGYGQNGLTWSFDRRAEASLKKKKDRSKGGNKTFKEKEVEIKKEEIDQRKSWAGADTAFGPAGWGNSMGRSSSSGRAEDAMRRNQMMKDQDHDYQKAKKVKLERTSGDDRVKFDQLPEAPRFNDDDHEME
ncbi:hypothetical protein IFR05_006110 [Cadophora sp. M221]|nr:hypothetical protein IFR05_006110 [Cadophora sp. M221]